VLTQRCLAQKVLQGLTAQKVLLVLLELMARLVRPQI
jgi:hypothetical protein